MRILLDECVDQRLDRLVEGHEAHTVSRRGWNGTKNGALLELAAGEYEVFITTDRNLALQQNVPELDIAIVVLVAASTTK
jgi:predicted nuclease of predicted toxin-antitoxin system